MAGLERTTERSRSINNEKRGPAAHPLSLYYYLCRIWELKNKVEYKTERVYENMEKTCIDTRYSSREVVVSYQGLVKQGAESNPSS